MCDGDCEEQTKERGTRKKYASSQSGVPEEEASREQAKRKSVSPNRCRSGSLGRTVSSPMSRNAASIASVAAQVSITTSMGEFDLDGRTKKGAFVVLCDGIGGRLRVFVLLRKGKSVEAR